ncbi:hypothetical protein RJ641_032540 [Dillenia turbinata]|uniref:tRNA pseudouridine synthase n=1 Tax=Dillenia turbinata TaxID=194707 RepID=A0AAN8ZIJ6_9MAGN
MTLHSGLNPLPTNPSPKNQNVNHHNLRRRRHHRYHHREKIRYKRRKIAIFFAYCGLGYQGMQKNPGAKTIEGDLEEALYLSGAVPEQDRGQPKGYGWARSARTDKGVSAVGPVTELNVNGKEVSNGEPGEEPKGLIETTVSELHCESMNQAGRVKLSEIGCGREMVKGESNLGENGDEKCVKQNEFSYGERERERFNRFLRHYVGTHNSVPLPLETKAGTLLPGAYIISFEANKVVTVEGIDFVKCKVIGQELYASSDS